MPNPSNIARPYANAVFEFAQAEQEDLADWQHALDLLATIAADPQLIAFSGNPSTTAEQLQEIILDTAATARKVSVDKLHPPFVNLIKLLCKNRRIDVIPDIAVAFSSKKDQAEKVISAEMITATKIDRDRQQSFSDALQSTLGKSVDLEFTVDESLIGGAVIRAGDRVIDGSVKAQLEQLEGAIGC